MQFALCDDLLILTSGGFKNLRIIKLTLYQFEGMSGLETNFLKTCLYTCRLGELPELAAAATLHCNYLGIQISGRRPCRQDWEGVILKVRRRLASWKMQHLSLGGRLTLVNLILSKIPTYWMPIFRLPCWVIKDIDCIRRDFLLSGPDIDHLGCRLVCWKNLCRPRDLLGWGILELSSINQALLGK